MASGNRIRGFTLIELMIVLVVIGIISSIAVPAYLEYAKRARRSDAAQLMMTIASKQQQYLLDARAFTEDPVALGIGRQKWACSTTACSNEWYNVTIQVVAAPPPSFTVTGSPIAGTRQSDDGTLSLTSAGVSQRVVGGVDKGW